MGWVWWDVGMGDDVEGGFVRFGCIPPRSLWENRSVGGAWSLWEIIEDSDLWRSGGVRIRPLRKVIRSAFWGVARLWDDCLGVWMGYR